MKVVEKVERKMHPRDIYNLGVAYRLFIKDVERITESLFRMYDEGVLQKGNLHIKRFLLREGGYDYPVVEKIAEELSKGNYGVIDRKTFEILVDAVKNTMIDNITKTIPEEIRNSVEFQRGFGILDK